MVEKRQKVTREKLLELSKARGQALQDLEDHLNRSDGSEILAEKHNQIVRELEKEIADMVNLWLVAGKPYRPVSENTNPERKENSHV